MEEVCLRENGQEVRKESLSEGDKVTGPENVLKIVNLKLLK